MFALLKQLAFALSLGDLKHNGEYWAVMFDIKKMLRQKLFKKGKLL